MYDNGSDAEWLTVCEYRYDAWGKLVQTTTNPSASNSAAIAEMNPFRYRGYVYDSETGLYYLQSRYYNPEWCRFINADSIMATPTGVLGTNMFAYCNNNPINSLDHEGTMPSWLKKTLTVVAAGIGAGAGFAGKYIEDVTYNAVSGKTGAVTGMMGGMALAGAPAAVSPLISTAKSTAAVIRGTNAVFKPAIQQGLEVVSGRKTDFNPGQYAYSVYGRVVTGIAPRPYHWILRGVMREVEEKVRGR